MNNIIISGRLVADPETRTGNSVEYTNFVVAVDRRSKDKKTDFIPCIAFDKVGQLNGNQIEKDGKKLTYWQVKVDNFDFVENKNSENKVTEPAEIADDDFPF